MAFLLSTDIYTVQTKSQQPFTIEKLFGLDFPDKENNENTKIFFEENQFFVSN